MAGLHATNRHKEDSIHGFELGKARLVQDADGTGSHDVKLVLSRKDTDKLAIHYQNESGKEGYHSSSELLSYLSDHPGLHDGRIHYTDSSGRDHGLVFEFNQESLALNKRGQLVLKGARAELSSAAQSGDLFDHEEIFGSDTLSRHSVHLKSSHEVSQRISDVKVVFDSLSDDDWIDAAQDYHYSATKDYVRLRLEALGGKSSGQSLPNRNSLVSVGDVNLGTRTSWFGEDWFDAVVEVFTPVADTISSGIDTATSWVSENIIEPISDPVLWDSIVGSFDDGWSYTEQWFDDVFYPTFDEIWGGAINWFGDWLPSTGHTAFSGNLTNLLSKDWQYGNSSLSLDLAAALEGDCKYSLPTSMYELFDGSDFGSVEISVGMPLRVSAAASLGLGSGLSVPLVEDEVEGPEITLTLPQSGDIVGGQLATSLGYGIEAYASQPWTSPTFFTYEAGVTPELFIKASKNGFESSSQFKNPYLTSPNGSYDMLTQYGMKFHLTPQAEISVGLFVPDQVPLFGGDKLATVGAALTVPMVVDAKTTPQGASWFSFEDPSAEFTVSADYSVDAKFLETLSDNGWIDPLTYNLAEGTIASWGSGNII